MGGLLSAIRKSVEESRVSIPQASCAASRGVQRCCCQGGVTGRQGSVLEELYTEDQWELRGGGGRIWGMHCTAVHAVWPQDGDLGTYRQAWWRDKTTMSQEEKMKHGTNESAFISIWIRCCGCTQSCTWEQREVDGPWWVKWPCPPCVEGECAPVLWAIASSLQGLQHGARLVAVSQRWMAPYPAPAVREQH